MATKPTTMKCQRKGCLSQATGAIAFNVPAKDIPLDQHKPIRLVLALCTCDRCRDELRPAEFLEADPRIKLLIEHLTASLAATAALAVPDFDRAFITKVEFDDPAYIRLKAKNG